MKKSNKSRVDSAVKIYVTIRDKVAKSLPSRPELGTPEFDDWLKLETNHIDHAISIWRQILGTDT